MTDPDSSILSSIVLLLVLVALNAFFAMTEIAIISLNDTKIKRMAQTGDKKAKTLFKLTGEPSKFLATIQVGVTLSGFLASAVAADTFTEYIVQAFSSVPISPSTVRAISLVVITFALSYITLVFGELVPKRVAMRSYEKISFAITNVVAFCAFIFKPFVILLSASTNGVLRIMGIDPHDNDEKVTEEEIRMMIDVGGESGTIEPSEKDMLNNVFEFDDRTAEETMTHRTEIMAFEINTPLDEVIKVALESGYSRIPVYEDDIDSIVGILYVKDLLALVSKNEGEFSLAKYMRPPLYALESTSCSSLLSEFKEKKIQMAVVVDEYGGTSGLVSMEDLLEGIVGNIQDEYDDEEEDISETEDGRYIVDALASIEDVFKFFSLITDDSDDYDTIGGYIINELGYIPSEDDKPSVMIGNVCFSVQEMDERRIEKLLAQIIPVEEQDDEAITSKDKKSRDKDKEKVVEPLDATAVPKA